MDEKKDDTGERRFSPVTPVAGYTEQSELRLGLVNRNKANEERLLRLLDIDARAGDVDLRWLSIARTDLEKAFMAWNRAIMQPRRIRLAEDAPVNEAAPK